ncbi:MAG: hypothetical protein ACYCR4_13625 [Acidimicrobiales bacterium]
MVVSELVRILSEHLRSGGEDVEVVFDITDKDVVVPTDEDGIWPVRGFEVVDGRLYLHAGGEAAGSGA